MLHNNFFSIASREVNTSCPDVQNIHVRIRLNPDHPVFKGHFPGNPVVPGVCQVQMIREILEDQTGTPLRLVESDTIKFLSMIDPRQHPELDFSMQIKNADGPQLSVTASISQEPLSFLKFKGKFEPS